MSDNTPKDTLLSTTRVSGPTAENQPLIVVGLPRSGSSFLSHVLSQIGDWYVFDDLYLQDKAQAIGATGPLDAKALDELLHFLGWQIRARLKFGAYALPKVSMDEIEPMNSALRETFTGTDARWTDLQAEWLTRLAHRNGCGNWGYKQPKAFRSLTLLRRAYPRAKILWLMRDPHDVLASFKFMSPDSKDGNPEQYHPIAYAHYWRMAAQTYFTTKNRLGEDVSFVSFDQLVADPQETAERIAAFLGTDAPGSIEIPERPNSSFGSDRPRRTLTGLETAIINRVCFPVAERMGFSPRPAKIRLADIADLTSRSYRFAKFRLSERRTRWVRKS